MREARMASSELEKGLARHLQRVAPNIEVEGLSQSRRIEGQFTSRSDTRGFKRISIMGQEGAGAFSDTVLQVVNAVSRFHRGQRRGTCPVFVRVFGPGGSSEPRVHKLRDIGIKHVVEDVCDRAGTGTPDSASVLDNVGAVRRDDLLLVLHTNRKIDVAAKAREQLQRTRGNRVLWIALSDASMATGQEVPDGG
jgi:hypothetical protein